MATGRRKELRLHALAQSAVVWNPPNGAAAEEFVARGVLGSGGGKPVLSPELRAEVDRKMDEYMTTGILTVD